MPTTDLLALYAEFESRAFPESWTDCEHDGLTVMSDSGGHTIVLAESEEFWDDYDGSASCAAWDRLEPLYRDYELAATAAWGAPRAVDIDDRLARGESSPFTELLLQQGISNANFWARGDRALGLSLGQADKELPIRVIAFVVSTGDL